jgi:branched-chain amino acid aminotransferase
MVFEGIRAYWNGSSERLFVFRLDDHSSRLEQSVRLTRMECGLTASDFSNAVLQTLRENGVRQTAHIRQMVYVDGYGEMFGAGPVSLAVVVTPKGGWFADKPGVHACFGSWQRISDHSMPPRIKCAANYQNGRLALVQARLDRYDSVILLNSAGKVAEELRTCVFVRRGNQVATPPITSGILESITRSALIQLFGDLHGIEVVEREIDRTEFYLADEAFICGTGLEVVPILSIDRHLIAKGQPGRLTTTVREQYFQVARGEMPQYQHWLTLC